MLYFLPLTGINGRQHSDQHHRAISALLAKKINKTTYLVENHPDSLPDGFVPRTVMVFVADGIQYTLQGHVPVQTMREVVCAMTY